MNLIDVQKQFASDEQCLDYLEKLRWPDGVRCPICGHHSVSRVEREAESKNKRNNFYQCLEPSCKQQFSATSGTIFHDSHLSLTKWFLAVALIVDAKKGISAKQLQRHLGIGSYKTAWYLAHRIRKAMEKGDFFGGKLGSGGKVVEADETYIGGRYDKRRKRARHDKPAVMGIVERKGRIKAGLIPTASKQVLIGKVRENVADDVKFVATDEATGYKHLGKYLPHHSVNHSSLEFVRGEVHTNTVENFWSLFKRGLVGSFHQVSVKHLPRYINEFSYRFNNRADGNLFLSTLGHLATTDKMSYAELIDRKKDAVPF